MKTVVYSAHRGNQVFLTTEAFQRIAETTIHNHDCFEKEIRSEYEL